MSRTAIWILNIGLLVLCCFLGAQIFTLVMGGILPGGSDPVAQAPRVAAAPAKTWEQRQAILTRNLFNSKSLAPAAAPSPEEIDEEYAKTKLPLKLLGTVASAQPELAWAAVEDLDTRENLVVRVNDKLKGRAEVLRIDPRRIVLLNAGRKEELNLDLEEGGKKRRPARGRTGSRSSRRRSAGAVSQRSQRNPGGAFSAPPPDPRETNRGAALDNPAAVFSQARILPKYENGEMVGVQLDSIKPGSLFEEIGIRNGDTIRELNGITVSDQTQSAEAMQQLGSAKEFSITVVGTDGSTRQLQHEVR